MISSENVARVFAEQFSRAPVWIARAPGRVNIIGEHTDYNGGFVLPCAINRDIVLAAAPREDHVLRLYSLNYGERFDVDLTQPLALPKRRGWYSYLLATAAQFVERGFELPGLEVAIEGDVPLGSGLSSSAALEVAMATLLNHILGAGLSSVEVALLAQAAEHSPFVGVRCGIMDQFASALGSEDQAILLDCHTHEFEGVPLGGGAFEIVIIDSMKRRGLVDSAYNERREACEQGLEILRKKSGVEYPSLRHVPREVFESCKASLPENICKRVRHNISENERVVRFAELAREGNWEEAGRLLYESHASLRDDFEVSCVELDAIVDAAAKVPGVLGCRMTGAGFGGCAVAMVRPTQSENFIHQMQTLLKKELGQEPIFYVTKAEEGARVRMFT
ncbi:galactokinase [candidate division BRC1 bacterium HGW-BRC1-1]|jgi:galactokinase|nr:MAG: galactokinase [candidate division BRC1 bacterium HGW-BRC1-1]